MYYEIEEEINKSDLMTKFNKIVTYIFFIATMILAFGLFFLLFVITYIIYYFYKRGFQPFTKKTYYEKIFLRLSEIRALNLFEKRSKKSKSTKEINTAESTVKAKLTKTK